MVSLIKKNMILSIAVLGYMIVSLINIDTMFDALENSKYYFIEMLQILPPIFILTSLIQTWVPTRVIVKHFGDGNGIKGGLISFLIGSLSAGPIYAAFPVCKTLLKKGASIKNIVIILSAWAVVKVPMLINEVKFMGSKYMLVRWVFTVIAIVMMSIIVGLIVKEKDIKLEEDELVVNKKICIKCGLCINKYPDFYEKLNGNIIIKSGTEKSNVTKTKMVCPVNAIG